MPGEVSKVSGGGCAYEEVDGKNLLAATGQEMMQAIEVPLPVASIRPCPIGAIVAAHWIAHATGPCPDFADVSDAVRYGLVTLSDGWGVTAHGASALREHGWL
jgi:hypothetical protein